MHIAILIIAVILVGGGILVRNKTILQTPEEVVLGESAPTNSPTPSNTPIPTQSAPTPTSPAESREAGSSSAGQDLAPPDTNLADFIYPGATTRSQSPNSVSLTSTDDAQTITDWYKNKIKELGMSTRSFVQTKTNDNVNNVLSAAKSNDEIKVTITKNAGESLVSIVVTR